MSKARKTLLLIDDEPSMSQLVSMTLGDSVEVLHAASGAEAFSMMAERRPDVVLLDLGLHEEDGLDLIPRLRDASPQDPIPVVVFSVHDSRRHEAIGAGAHGFVPKPFSSEDMYNQLAAFLE